MQSTKRPPFAHPVLRIAAILAVTAVAAPAGGQSASVGADVVSRYVWRGTDFGESMAVQPALTFSLGNLEAGAWGSYSVSRSGADGNENDLWASYTVTAGNGASISLGFTDYYFPSPDAEHGFRNADAHTLELSLGFSGPESFPVSLYGGMLVQGDENNSVYLEASFPVDAVEGVDVGLVAGMVAGESGFYGTEGAALVNLGVSAGTEVEITDSFALPVSVSWIVNPDADRAFPGLRGQPGALAGPCAESPRHSSGELSGLTAARANRGGRIRTGDLLLPNRSKRDANPGKESHKSNWDCTICASCRWGMSWSAGPKKPENRVKWRAFGGERDRVTASVVWLGTCRLSVCLHRRSTPPFGRVGRSSATGNRP